ncbi:hypothetical protein [Devosia sediminis]|uniref:Uncharacterized protein n=1 Tax=Devosia sediminis TaxID=2798801 RepID=A0A934IVI9_9HYPH|nr:hypothetical protein [Devosia sediminis]MBJ3783568.1 hypothetical protein [Devosia sediminis]
MDKHQKTGPAQPDDIEQPEEDRSPARVRDRQREGGQKGEDQPGADGQRSAGASEDTYD